MEKNKICFITCVNDERLYLAALDLIKKLHVPQNIIVETLALRKQTSMAEGYNNAMRLNKAKYKVYMHQDTLIVNKNFIYDVLSIFEKNDHVGMMGVAGAEDIPPSGIWWEANLGGYSKKHGKVYECHKSLDTETLRLWSFGVISGDYIRVRAIDGLVMITQYDLPWRADLFDGWHFYDVSQSLEFIRKGYEIIIPNQAKPWIIHACYEENMVRHDYDYYREIFLKEYKHDLSTI